jgi:trans-aconitate 2-methyltransferase
MADWNPELYQRCAGERTRPALDLLARVPLSDPAVVVDLGCGSGLSTAPLVARYPKATVSGMDSSPAMLAEAARTLPGVRLIEANVTTWAPPAPVDLLFSNALLQWVPDHAALLPRLMGLLTPGGVLAFQIPVNFHEASHRLMPATADAMPFSAKFARARTARPGVPTLGETWDILVPHAASVEIWETTYQHPLADHDAIVEMIRSTGLRPWLERLDAAETDAYLAAYRDGLRAAYPRRADGRVLYPFPRRFVVATR